ncbi:hypothetical protein M758_1G132600 [Ceratodon purpureus]|nr:hypothetical protein M758_1G132600 [Ceratodon purpureus]
MVCLCLLNCPSNQKFHKSTEIHHLPYHRLRSDTRIESLTFSHTTPAQLQTSEIQNYFPLILHSYITNPTRAKHAVLQLQPLSINPLLKFPPHQRFPKGKRIKGNFTVHRIYFQLVLKNVMIDTQIRNSISKFSRM